MHTFFRRKISLSAPGPTVFLFEREPLIGAPSEGISLRVDGVAESVPMHIRESKDWRKPEEQAVRDVGANG